MYQQRRALLQQGMTDHDLRAQVNTGRLTRLRHGVYGPPLAGSPEQLHLERIRVTLAQLREGACASHGSAALIHGLPVPGSWLRRVQVVRPGRGGKVGGTVHLRRGKLEPEDVVATPFGPATSLERTAVDLARALPAIHAVALLDQVLRRGVPLDDLLTRLRQRVPGNQQARQVLSFADARSESVGESHSRWLMHELGLPAPELQHEVVNAEGELVARTDFWWPQLQVVGEFDGMIKYGRLLKPGQTLNQVLMAEKFREEALRRQGLWVIRWIWAELDDRQAFERMLRRGLGFGAAARSTA